ncbi:MAG TPA: lipoate--protein ligase family protein [Verrucomicrobiae bacterium]|nr:lipoate--protein ligase family protein [Verrucomicrobiae bacterium]
MMDSPEPLEYCDLPLGTPEETLAYDEVLLDRCEAGRSAGVLRFWEPAGYFVVVGYANAVGREVNLEFCGQRGIPVLRRCSGGGTVLQGPGCLNYSLVLPLGEEGPLHSISGTNEFVMERNRQALAGLLPGTVTRHGHTDLALGEVKFSGNAQRRRQKAVLFHGCFLLQMNLELIEQALPFPTKAPGYRLGRSHRDFLMNLGVPAAAVKEALRQAWNARGALTKVPLEEIARLVHEKYGREEWRFKF